MPHLTLEYTDNVAEPTEGFEALLARLHRALAASGEFSLDNCKGRALPLTRYCVAGGERDAGFVHLDVRILSGRSLRKRRALSELLLAELERGFADLRTCLSVDIREMVPETYRKRANGPTHDAGRAR